ncbi:MAG: homoserine kinase [Chloroflexi bacterium]|nr:homoserine kinase [Chloroflexota bacterium]
MTTIIVRVPATTANLGPAFDCLGLALNLWNEVELVVGGTELVVEVRGEGERQLPKDKSNLIVRAMQKALEAAEVETPKGIKISCQNGIPLNSGLGSSAAATLSGLLAGNALARKKLSKEAMLQLGAEIESHADNLAAALLGGLVLVRQEAGSYKAKALACAKLRTVVLLPDVQISTQEARAALAATVPLPDAVANIGNALLLAEALRSGDIALMAEAMEDRLHQPARLGLIPGAEEALDAAKKAGAAAALSGAGPSVIAFIEAGNEDIVLAALRQPFTGRGIETLHFLLETSSAGASVEVRGG